MQKGRTVYLEIFCYWNWRSLKFLLSNTISLDAILTPKSTSCILTILQQVQIFGYQSCLAGATLWKSWMAIKVESGSDESMHKNIICHIISLPLLFWHVIWMQLQWKGNIVESLCCGHHWDHKLVPTLWHCPLYRDYFY